MSSDSNSHGGALSDKSEDSRGIDWTGISSTLDSTNQTGSTSVVVLLFVAENQQQFQCQVKPFRFELAAGKAVKGHWILEKTIDFKLLTGPINVATNTDPAAYQPSESESVSLDVSVENQLLISKEVLCLHETNKLSNSSELKENAALKY